uniref:hypothetical protein n=1 Tax=Nocardia suismassiliense TaxID=2077092 RepID=UPI003F493D3D
MTRREPDAAATLGAALEHLEQCRVASAAVTECLDSLGDPTILSPRLMSARMVGMGRMRAIHALLDDAEQAVRHALAENTERN